MNRREALGTLAGLVGIPGIVSGDFMSTPCRQSYPQPGPTWPTWHEAAADMARFERNAIRDHHRLKRLGVPWLDAYEPSGVVRWRDDVSLVFATSNHGDDVSDLLRCAVAHFRQVGVAVLGNALTPCRAVGCCFVGMGKAETERIIGEWVS